METKLAQDQGLNSLRDLIMSSTTWYERKLETESNEKVGKPEFPS